MKDFEARVEVTASVWDAHRVKNLSEDVKHEFGPKEKWDRLVQRRKGQKQLHAGCFFFLLPTMASAFFPSLISLNTFVLPIPTAD